MDNNVLNESDKQICIIENDPFGCALFMRTMATIKTVVGLSSLMSLFFLKPHLFSNPLHPMNYIRHGIEKNCWHEKQKSSII